MGIKDSKDIIYYPNGEKAEMIWDYETNRNFSHSFRPDVVRTYNAKNDTFDCNVYFHGKPLYQCVDECYKKITAVNMDGFDFEFIFAQS